MKRTILQVYRSKNIFLQAELFDYLPESNTDPVFPDKTKASESFITALVHVRLSMPPSESTLLMIQSTEIENEECLRPRKALLSQITKVNIQGLCSSTIYFDYS